MFYSLDLEPPPPGFFNSNQVQTTELSGYDPNRFVSDKLDDFTWPVCQWVVRKPVECTNWDKLTWESCAESIVRYNTRRLFKCPMWNYIHPHFPVKPSRILLKIIGELQIHCENELWPEIVNLADIDNHTELWQYKMISCGNVWCLTEGVESSFIPVETRSFMRQRQIKQVCSSACVKTVKFRELLNENSQAAIEKYFKLAKKRTNNE